MDIQHVNVRRHDLFELVAPEIGVASPVRPPFERSPGAAKLAAAGGKPLEEAYTDETVGEIEGGAGREKAGSRLCVQTRGNTTRQEDGKNALKKDSSERRVNDAVWHVV